MKTYLIKYKNNTEEIVDCDTDQEAEKWASQAPKRFGKVISIQCVKRNKRTVDILYQIV